MFRRPIIVSAPLLLLSCGSPAPVPDAPSATIEGNVQATTAPPNVTDEAPQETATTPAPMADNAAGAPDIETADAREAAPTAPPVATPAEFASCAGCHATTPGAAHGIGPNLHGIAGQPAGSREGYAYSEPLRGSGLIWSAETLDAFLAAPRETVPGTRMAVPGLADPEKRRVVVRYLMSLR